MQGSSEGESFIVQKIPGRRPGELSEEISQALADPSAPESLSKPEECGDRIRRVSQVRGVDLVGVKIAGCGSPAAQSLPKREPGDGVRKQPEISTTGDGESDAEEIDRGEREFEKLRIRLASNPCRARQSLRNAVPRSTKGENAGIVSQALLRQDLESPEALLAD